MGEFAQRNGRHEMHIHLFPACNSVLPQRKVPIAHLPWNMQTVSGFSHAPSPVASVTN